MHVPLRKRWPILVLSAAIAFGIILVGLFFYVRARSILEDRIRERLQGIAAAATLHIDGDTVDRIQGVSDMTSTDYQDLVRFLERVQELPDIRFVYILRRTEDPMNLMFVADADALSTPSSLDVDRSGTVEPDEEPGFPGDLYEISDIPALQGPAFEAPTADEEITFDQWGPLISGYAPIRSAATGEVRGVLGIDMQADDFLEASQSIFSPLALLLLFIGAVFIAGTVVVFLESEQLTILRKINAERSGLLRLTFHQLGEPLTIMKWSLETLREEAHCDELKKIVSDHIVCMDEGLGRLNSIIDTLQLAEKVDLNTLEYLPIQTSLRHVLENAIGEWNTSAKSGAQKILLEMPDDLEIVVDPTLIGIALRQILVNAIEYSPDDARITLTVRRGHKDIAISVADHGCGIPPADQAHLFEKYRRASNAHLSKPDGNGLGLYIAKGIIEKAGGRIWVESEVGKGTTVHFTLPLTGKK